MFPIIQLELTCKQNKKWIRNNKKFFLYLKVYLIYKYLRLRTYILLKSSASFDFRVNRTDLNVTDRFTELKHFWVRFLFSPSQTINKFIFVFLFLMKFDYFENKKEISNNLINKLPQNLINCRNAVLLKQMRINHLVKGILSTDIE